MSTLSAKPELKYITKKGGENYWKVTWTELQKKEFGPGYYSPMWYQGMSKKFKRKDKAEQFMLMLILRGDNV